MSGYDFQRKIGLHIIAEALCYGRIPLAWLHIDEVTTAMQDAGLSEFIGQPWEALYNHLHQWVLECASNRGILRPDNYDG
jgi:hypothetical protein